MTNNNLLRKLSHGENAFFLNSVSVPTMTTIVGEIEQSVITKAWYEMIKATPLLHCQIATAEEEPFFSIRSEEIPSITEQQIYDECEAIQAFDAALNQGARPNKTLISLRVLRLKNTTRIYLLSNFSHIISDGTSNVAFHKALLQKIDSLNSGTVRGYKVDNYDTHNLDKPKPPYPIEDYLVPRFDGADINSVIHAYQRIIKSKDHFQLHKIANGSTCSPEVKSVIFHLSKAESDKLINWCRKNSVTVSIGIIAALIKTANRLSAKEKTPILLRQAVNLRSLVDPKISSLQCITAATSILTSITAYKSNNLQQLCKLVAKSTKDALEFAPTLQNHIANKEIYRHSEVPICFHISNLGKLDLHNDYDSFNVENVIVAPSSSFQKTIPIFITTYEGRLNINCHADSSFYPIEFVRQLIQGSLAHFEIHTEVETITSFN